MLRNAYPDGLSDAQIFERLGGAHGVRKTSMARWHSWHDDGMVEPAGTTINGRKIKLWRAVMEPDRYLEVRREAGARPKRRIRPVDLSTTERASLVVALLRDPVVAKAVVERQVERGEGKASQRARAAANRETQSQVRERKAAEKRARADGNAATDFIIVKNHLRDAARAVHATTAGLRMERARVDNGETPRIPPAYWPDIVQWTQELMGDGATLLDELADAGMVPVGGPCPACGRDGSGAVELDQGYDADADAELVDADVIEIY